MSFFFFFFFFRFRFRFSCSFSFTFPLDPGRYVLSIKLRRGGGKRSGAGQNYRSLGLEANIINNKKDRRRRKFYGKFRGNGI